MKNNKFRMILQNRKNLYLILGLTIVSIYTLTIAYAALDTILEIRGNAEVVGSNWSFLISKFTEDEVENLGDERATIEGNFLLFGDASLISSGNIYGTSVSEINVSILKPGDGFAGLYKITNTGSLPAKIQSASLRNINYTSLINNTADIEWARNNMTYEFEIGADDIDTLEEYVMCPGSSINVGIMLLINESAKTIPSSTIELDNIGVDVSFVQADAGECN